MKYSTEVYGKALAESLSAASSREAEKKILAAFMKIVVRNGDAGGAGRILDTAKRLLAKQGKGDVVVIEAARPLPPKARERILKHVENAGSVEERIVPDLVAGVRIVVNDERELDASLMTRLHQLFN